MDTEAYGKVLAAEDTLWFYVSRRRILEDLILKYIPLPINRHLDLGCGSGGIIRYLSRYTKHSVGMDISLKALTNAQEKDVKSLCLGDGCFLGFPDDTFNLVTLLDVLEHCQDDSELLKTIWKVLKPGGFCIIFVPALKILWSNLDNYSHHYRRYSRAELQRVSQESSFNIIRLSYFNSFLFPVIFAGRMVQHLIQKPKGEPSKYDFAMPSRVLNRIMTAIFSAERFWLRSANFPIGSSVLALLQKPLDDQVA